MDLLVSIVVVTFNAESTILESLDSIYKQSYPLLEIIISDDGSSDKTIELAREWCEQHSKRFQRIEIIESQNTGVVLNLNRGLRKCNGEWIKEMSGDDVIPPNAISDGIKYIQQANINTICCFKSIDFYIDDNGKCRFGNIHPDFYTERTLAKNSKKQYKTILREYVIVPSSTALINRQFHESVGWYDENFPFIEDYPFTLKIAKKGFKIHFYSEIITYCHRINMNSTNQRKNEIMNSKTFGTKGILTQQDKMFVLPNISKMDLIFWFHYYLNIFRRFVVINIFKNKKRWIVRLVNWLLYSVDPFIIKRKIINLFHKKNKKESDNRSLLIMSENWRTINEQD